jgi:type VI secretion system protein ImpL
MQASWQTLAAAVGVILAGMIAWFAGILVHLQGANLWIFRGGLFLLILLIGGAVFLWYRSRHKSASSQPASSEGGPSGENDDILSAIGEAEMRIAKSSRLPAGTTLSSLPILFILGEVGAGKTSVVKESGLEAELLSGNVYQEDGIAPTRLANFWYAQKTILIELAGGLLGDTGTWSRLLKSLLPGRFKSILHGGPTAPRAAVVCFDCEKLAKVGRPDEVTPHSRAIRTRLEHISQSLGINFPVYVIFTRADRLPYFEEYFRNLTNDEVTQVLGVTVPVLSTTSTGVYAEQESKRLKTALTSIFHSMAECRAGLLYREFNDSYKPGIYEFPREFEKRLPAFTQFLLDLCRPSHLRSGPFLRGFYFTGVRLVDAQSSGMAGTFVATPPSPAPSARKFSPNATAIFRADDAGQATSWKSGTLPGVASDAAKVRQWAFLSHIFSHIILQDKSALGASGASTKTNSGRRILFGLLTAIAAIWIIGMTVSFFYNRQLQREVSVAAARLAAVQRPAAVNRATLDELRHLDAARVVLERLEDYEENGHPWRMAWGLYTGHELYEDLRRVYFYRFDELLLTDTRAQMLAILRKLPSCAAGTVAAPEESNSQVFETLKAYLMITSNPEKSDPNFLGPRLTGFWSTGEAESDRNGLAKAQFTYFANQLLKQNPREEQADIAAIEQARAYLRTCNQAESRYRALLAQADVKFPPFDFAKRYPDAAGLVKETKVVRGAFTKPAWEYVASQIPNLDQFASDDWVLGPGGVATLNVAGVQNQIRDQYAAEYTREWREYIRGAAVTHFVSAKDASSKLGQLSDNRSPLLALLCEATENTGLSPNGETVAKAFQPVREVEGPGCPSNLLASAGTQSYVGALLKSKDCYEEMESAPPDQHSEQLRQCNTHLSQNIDPQITMLVKTIDPDGLDKTVRKLLQLVPPPPPPQTPGKELCDALNSLSMKYPVNPNSRDEATFEEFNLFFTRDTGTLTKYIDKHKDDLERRGDRYQPKRGSQYPVNLIPVVNRALDIQDSLFPKGATKMQYQFLLKASFPDLPAGKVTIDGQSMDIPANGQGSKTFTWPGTPGEARIDIENFSYGNKGPWAAFRLFETIPWTPITGGYRLSGYLKGTGDQPLEYLGKPVNLQFEIDTQSEPIFRKGYLSALRCPAKSK